MDVISNKESGKKIYRIVLTGGPCGGKTTCINRLGTFFEDLGWKVFRICEVVYIYMSGGLKFQDLNDESVYMFQQDLIYSMIAIEKTFQHLAESDPNPNVLILCDRGIKDACAYMKPGQWDRMMLANDWTDLTTRDSRYDQVVHMVSASKGASDFYSLEGHGTRHETKEEASVLDDLIAEAWLGHPFYCMIDNSTGFEQKINRTIQAVCERLGVDAADRLAPHSRKRKFLVGKILPMADLKFQDFKVLHHYLRSFEPVQIRIRKRGTEGKQWTYSYTVRGADKVETKRVIDKRDYQLLLAQADPHHLPVLKRRRCFLWNNHHFTLDTFLEPYHPRCRNVTLLETYTTNTGSLSFPHFLQDVTEVTGNNTYSMYNLCLKEDLTAAAALSSQKLFSNVLQGSFSVDLPEPNLAHDDFYLRPEQQPKLEISPSDEQRGVLSTEQTQQHQDS